MPKEFIDPELLESNFYTKDKQEVRYNFTEEELTQKKDEQYQISLKLRRRSDVKKQLAKLMEESLSKDDVLNSVETMDLEDIGEESIKTLKANLKEIIPHIRKGYAIRMQTVYTMQNFEDQTIDSYTDEGHLVTSRPMRQHEKQTTIHSIGQVS